jgi:hypothetical protein
MACLLCFMWIVQKARGISIISIKYRSLIVNRVKWNIALKPREKFMLGVEIKLP